MGNQYTHTFPWLFIRFDLLLAVTFLVSWDCFEKHKVFILWVILMYTALMNSEVHIVLSVFCLIENEHIFQALVGDTIMLNEILDRDEVSDIFWSNHTCGLWPSNCSCEWWASCLCYYEGASFSWPYKSFQPTRDYIIGPCYIRCLLG